jgi:hypothetical protein
MEVLIFSTIRNEFSIVVLVNMRFLPTTASSGEPIFSKLTLMK